MLLKRLTEAAGVGGNEQEIRSLIKELLAEQIHDWQGDLLGNLIAVQNRNASGPKVMLAAHMDEVGFMIMGIDRSGLLRFRAVGGVDPRVLVSKVVRVGKEKIPGVIGAKAIHLQKPAEREQALGYDQLYIDIGAKSKEEAEKYVQIGDYVVFATEYEEMGYGMAKAKALDDRVGCGVLIEVLKERYSMPVFGAFTVQEEVGLRGAGVAAYAINPDLAIVLEGTTASDVSGTQEHGYSTNLGQGPALTFMDASVVSDKKLLQRVLDVASKHEIKTQFKRTVTGGSDAGRISLTREGIPTVVISVPTRYIHSPVSMINLGDFEQAVRLVKAVLRDIEEGGWN